MLEKDMNIKSIFYVWIMLMEKIQTKYMLWHAIYSNMLNFITSSSINMS